MLDENQQKAMCLIGQKDSVACVWGRSTGKSFTAGYLTAMQGLKKSRSSLVIFSPYKISEVAINEGIARGLKDQSRWVRFLLWCGLKSHSYAFSAGIINVNHPLFKRHYDLIVVDDAQTFPENAFAYLRFKMKEGSKVIAFGTGAPTDSPWYRFANECKTCNRYTTEQCGRLHDNFDEELVGVIKAQLGEDFWRMSYEGVFLKPRELKSKFNGGHLYE